AEKQQSIAIGLQKAAWYLPFIAVVGYNVALLLTQSDAPLGTRLLTAAGIYIGCYIPFAIPSAILSSSSKNKMKNAVDSYNSKFSVR
ncbi:MAG: hypothetical protein WBM07_09580, partial [Chitinivibrionales bacterium]